MTPEDKFRYLIAAGLILVLGVGVWHRLQARTGERLDRKQEGLFILVALRLAGFAVSAAVFAYLLKPSSVGFGAFFLPVWLRWGGVVLGGLTGLLLLWTLQSLGTNLTDTVVTRKQHTLVTTGPYRWVRHPFYVCAALLVLALTLVTANAVFLATGGLVIMLLARRTATEERNLLNRFGGAYQEYKEHTGRFIPRF